MRRKIDKVGFHHHHHHQLLLFPRLVNSQLWQKSIATTVDENVLEMRWLDSPASPQQPNGSEPSNDSSKIHLQQRHEADKASTKLGALPLFDSREPPRSQVPEFSKSKSWRSWIV